MAVNDYIIPTIGARGEYSLNAPFDTLMLQGEEYTCQAIRRLSDYIADNGNPQRDIYELYGISDAEYKTDLAENMYILSLQSDTGHWLYVPVSYLRSYPVANGIPYRTMMVGVCLGPMPVDSDFSHLSTMIENLTFDTLGIKPKIKLVEVSRVSLVSKEAHDGIVLARNQRASLKLTDSGRYMALQEQHQRALTKLAELEQYIKNHT